MKNVLLTCAVAMSLMSCTQVDEKGRIINHKLPPGLSDCEIYVVENVGNVVRCPNSQASVDDGYGDKRHEVNTVIDNALSTKNVVYIGESTMVVSTEKYDTMLIRNEKYDTIKILKK